MAGGDVSLKVIEERTNSWILDYSYYCAWKEFFSTNNIDLRTTRDFVQWIVTQPYIFTTERKLKVQILLFLCRLSDGSDHLTRYSFNSDLTALEESLKNVDMIETLLGMQHTDTISALKVSVKKQAVLVCCRANDFKAGKEVFERQWKRTYSEEEEKKVVDHLQTVLDSHDKDQSYIKFSTYDRFLKKALECLTVIHNTFSASFLLQQAECFERKSHLHKENINKFSLATMDECAKINSIKTLSTKAQQNLDLKLKQIRVMKKTKDRDQTESSSESDLEEERRPKKRRINESFPKKTETNQNNCNEQESSDDESLSPLRERLKLPTSSLLSSPKKGLRIPWSRTETESFYEAVKKIGVGNWNQIKENLHTFRTNVQLKDRWRSMSKDQSLMKSLKGKFGSK